MATGYTCKFEEKDLSFKEFALDCARAFGACISMRDDPSDKEIPEEFPVSDYYPRMIKKYQKELKKVTKMSLEDCSIAATKEFNTELNRLHESKEKNALLKERYENMIITVENWTPPSKDHEGLKNFMLQQLKSSLDFDCGHDYYDERIKDLMPLSGVEWKRRQIETTKELINSAKEHYKKEKETARKNTMWIKQLRKSLT